MIDFHSHILPQMDDGAKTLQISVEMLERQQQQGIEHIFLTPHYYRHRESIRNFLQRREESFRLMSEQDAFSGSVSLGAEVALERQLNEDPDIPLLTMGESGYILLEFPYTPHKSWMSEEVYNIMYTHKLKPILAHVERYLDWYGKSEMEEITSIPGTILQLNFESLNNRKAKKFMQKLIEQGKDVVFGTDSHNMTSRPPNSILLDQLLKPKLSAAQWEKLISFADNLAAQLIDISAVAPSQ